MRYRGGRESAMSRYGLVRVLTVVALAATLLMGSAAPASAMERSQTAKVWSWLEMLWRTGTSVWVPGGVSKPQAATVREKGGACVDPDGCADAQVTNIPGSPPCVRLTEGGPCIDPDG